jgi:signal transduction histidine kinase
VKDLMERARQRIQEHAERCGLSLCYDAEERAARLKVSVDASAVEQILFNLVDNACKYAGNSDEGPVEVRARRDGSEAVLAVRDHGPGIPKAEARQIFRPFHKSAEDAANSSPGVGLGLALSRRLARSMGGELRLKQTGGNGACFELRLPIVGTPEDR